MTGKFVATLMFLCISQLTLGDDLAQEKKAILERINKLNNEADKAYSTSCDVYHKRPIYLTPIKDRLRDLGESLLEMNLIEINQTAAEARQKARLVADSPKVYECIQRKKDAPLNRLQKSFNEGYVKALDNLLNKAFARKSQLSGQFSDLFNDLKQRVHIRADIAEEQIKITNSKGYLNNIIEEYEKFMADIIKQLLGLETQFKTNEINFDRTLQNGPLKVFRNYGRRVVDDFSEEVAKCFALV